MSVLEFFKKYVKIDKNGDLFVLQSDYDSLDFKLHVHGFINLMSKDENSRRRFIDEIINARRCEISTLN